MRLYAQQGEVAFWGVSGVGQWFVVLLKKVVLVLKSARVKRDSKQIQRVRGSGLQLGLQGLKYRWV